MTNMRLLDRYQIDEVGRLELELDEAADDDAFGAAWQRYMTFLVECGAPVQVRISPEGEWQCRLRDDIDRWFQEALGRSGA